MPSLGLAMIAQNEAVHIPSCLSQFFLIVDDMVVVDGGSQDDTVAWARHLGARVFERPFENDFSAQRNFAIAQLDTDWIYFHDPDERLEPPLVDLIPLLLTPEGQSNLKSRGVLANSLDFFDCFGFARKNFVDGVLSPIYPDHQYRLFQNRCHFQGRVHEEVTGFSNRTEVDFSRNKVDNMARFNILHYKSSIKQENQRKFYAQIERGEI